MLDGVVGDDARGAQLVAHLGDQWWNGGALGDLSDVGGGQDGGDGCPQVAGYAGVVLDQAAGEGVDEVAAAGPGAPAQSG